MSGAVWLNKEMLSVYDYWQFWRNTEDGDVGRFLRIFTDMPLAEIARLEALQGAELNDAKKILATEATAVLHGRARGRWGGRDGTAHLRGRRAGGRLADAQSSGDPGVSPVWNCGDAISQGLRTGVVNERSAPTYSEWRNSRKRRRGR
ncbi:MAG: hypothetical protein WDM81_15455 [Rhizomicrobium sp.]